MKKSLIALAVAGILVAPAAMADDVKVYGVVDMSFGSSSNGINSATQISSNTTKIGFKGSEDLGDGTSVVWQIEQQIDLANTNTATQTTPGTNKAPKTGFASRNSFLGLKSEGMGTVLMGIHDTPYKIATRHLDPFGDGIGDNRAIMGKGHDSRLSNVLAYISPSMNGFTVAAAYVAGANVLPAAAVTNKGDAVSLALMYDQNPFKVHFGYQSVKFGDTNTGLLAATGGDKTTAWKLGGSYDFGMATIGAIYEHIGSSGVSAAYANDAKKHNDWTVNGVIKVSGSDAVKLAYVKVGDTGNVVSTGAKQTSIGYDHNMSKRTKLYFVYTHVSNDSAATYGLADTSTGNPTAAGAAGQSVHAFGVGIKHAF